MGKPPRLFPMPIFVLKYIAIALNRSEELNKIIGSLKRHCVPRKTLNWIPLSVSEN